MSEVSKYIVIGTIKSGQNSMIEYLQKRFNIFTRKDEFMWRKDAVEIYKRKYLDNAIRPVFITRDPAQRIWSHFHYFNYSVSMSFEEFLCMRGHNDVFGEENPISQSNYSKWIRPFLPYDPIVVDVDDMQENPNFPTINKTSKEHDNYTQDIPSHFTALVNKYMEKELNFKEPCWSTDEEYDDFF